MTTKTFPKDTVQGLAIESGEKWWVEDKTDRFCRGRLGWSTLNHVGRVPVELTAEGRKNPAQHEVFKAKIVPLRELRTRGSLPVAALPSTPHERNLVYWGKRRPALLVCASPLIPGPAGKKHNDNGTRLVVPAYGADQNGKRRGFSEEIMLRARRAMYSQYLVDRLPLPGQTVESVFRFDHIQPVGKDPKWFFPTKWRLSEFALMFVEQWAHWHLTGVIVEESEELAMFKEVLLDL